MSTLATFSVPRRPIGLRYRVWACYALVAVFWTAAVVSRMLNDDHASFSFAAAVWMAFLPLADLLSVRLRRIARGRSLFGTDYRHLHHYLLAKGWSRAATVSVLVNVCCVLAVASYGAWRLAVPSPVLIVAAVVAFVAFHLWMTIRWKRLMGFCVVVTE
jgi:hypothetical protein